ncbi:BZ3500_MvSof-1268-A1-R1_Chr1-1g01135 [Microbotryum saponariae]|uniref:BZ3500_MvSof-1268-A1-R1_Chr1-1g01135 protein n=1 Tax=Microbotryum saponariae TaxID=289078 RepID=A0A2X0LC69_9BASI|nr:BZ3500_MvSof-1268-A1-R1_Chr1-1g01135 [Microbotryum saponariae]SCZ93473.1 BZ3501_MvSof-1269-A2-R1_Chr1-1g00732 [Microbotryum saponariae]
MNAYIVAFKKPEDHPTATDDHISELSKRVEQQGGDPTAHPVPLERAPGSGPNGSAHSLFELVRFRIKHVYSSRTMRGFAATMPDALKDEFEANPAIKYVEADGPVTTQ